MLTVYRYRAGACATMVLIVEHALRIILSILVSGATAVVYAPTLDRQAIEDAISVGQSRVETVRLRYHQQYRVHIGRAPVDYIDVVTPFRRLELAIEERARI